MEASGKACGVPLAMLPGQSRAPNPWTGVQRTWEPPVVALRLGGHPRRGQDRCRL